MYCLTCRYNLAQLYANRCPECGTSFDPQDPFTYRPALTGLSPVAQHKLKYDLILGFLWGILLVVLLPYALVAIYSW